MARRTRRTREEEAPRRSSRRRSGSATEEDSGNGKVVNFGGEDFIDAGIRSDYYGRVSEASFVMFDYAGKRTEKECAAKFLFDVWDESERKFMEQQHEHLTCGKKVVPSSDGRQLRVAPGAEGASKNSNFHQFIQSVEAAGFEGIKNDITVFEGAIFHIVRRPQKNREGLESVDDQGRPRMLPLVEEILEESELPGGSGGGTRSGGTKTRERKSGSETRGRRRSKAATSAAPEKLAIRALSAISEDGDEIKLDELEKAAHAELLDESPSDRKAALELIADDDFLAKAAKELVCDINWDDEVWIPQEVEE